MMRAGIGSMPEALIAMITVDRCGQSKRYGGCLLDDALKRIAEARRSLGVSIAVLDVLDDGRGGCQAAAGAGWVVWVSGVREAGAEDVDFGVRGL